MRFYLFFLYGSGLHPISWRDHTLALTGFELIDNAVTTPDTLLLARFPVFNLSLPSKTLRFGVVLLFRLDQAHRFGQVRLFAHRFVSSLFWPRLSLFSRRIATAGPSDSFSRHRCSASCRPFPFWIPRVPGHPRSIFSIFSAFGSFPSFSRLTFDGQCDTPSLPFLRVPGYAEGIRSFPPANVLTPTISI